MKFQQKTKDTIVVTEQNITSAGIPAVVTFENKMYGDIKITKVDKEFDQALSDIGFKIKLEGQYLQIFSKNDFIGTVEDKITLNPKYDSEPNLGDNHVKYISNETDSNKATIFKTNSAGEIEICNLAVGKPYEVIECSIGKELDKYYEVDGKAFYLDIRPLKNEPLEAYAYTFNTMLDYIQGDVNANKDIFERRLNDSDKERHIVNLINVFTGYNLYIPQGIRVVLNDNSDLQYKNKIQRIEELKRELEKAKSNNESYIESIRNELLRERESLNRELKDKIRDKYNNANIDNMSVELVQDNGERIPVLKVTINSCAVTILDGKIRSCEKINDNLVTNNFNSIEESSG